MWFFLIWWFIGIASVIFMLKFTQGVEISYGNVYVLILMSFSGPIFWTILAPNLIMGSKKFQEFIDKYWNKKLTWENVTDDTIIKWLDKF
jgi:hypothetical protein